MLILPLVLLTIIQRIEGVSNIFDHVHQEYLYKILRNTKASQMVNYINKSADPCRNFYEFACGNYKRINPPNDLNVHNIFQDLSDGMHRKFVNLLKPNETTDTLIDMKVKNFYEACMNLAILRNTYSAKLREIIHEFGIMPALEGDNWRDSNNFDWLRTIAEIKRKYGKIIILGCKFNPDMTNRKVKTLYVLPQTMPLGAKAAYTDMDQEAARNVRKMNIMYNFKYVFGLRTTEAEKVAAEIFAFEMQLFGGYKGPRSKANYTLNLEQSADVQLLTIAKLRNKYMPHLDIERLINITFGHLPTQNAYDDIAVDAENIIHTVDLTPDRIVANYIFYTLIEDFLLIPDLVTRNLESFMILTKPTRKPQLQKVCVAATEFYFPEVLNNMIYRKYMSNGTEQNLLPLWDTIKLSLLGILDANRHNGMRDIYTTAKNKLQAMRFVIQAYKGTNFNAEYEDLRMTKHDYVENVKAIKIFRSLKSRGHLYQPYREFVLDKPVHKLPAYQPLENIVAVPVSLLQPYYLWSNAYPSAIKYSTVGFLIAREVINSFQYIYFDTSGNLYIERENDFFKYYNHIVPCFEVQYHSYYLEGRALPRLETHMQNVADSGGIRVAYNAYLRWYKDLSRENAVEEYLPKLNYTNEQLFFLSYGQMLCSAGSDLTQPPTDNMAVEPYRVNQALSNLENFSKAFKCSEYSNMNPLTKCNIY